MLNINAIPCNGIVIYREIGIKKMKLKTWMLLCNTQHPIIPRTPNSR